METQISIRPAQRSFPVFSGIWFGQMISLMGSGLTSFALGVWVYQTTGKVTDYALIALFTVLPTLLLSLISGALVGPVELPNRDVRERLRVCRNHIVNCRIVLSWQA